jgi:hypothetical protein
VDRRAKKLEKKRKSRDQAKKNVRVLAARESQKVAVLARSAGSAEVGPCYVSEGWEDLTIPHLVTVLVTRKLSTGHFVPGIALVDRTCLGVKNGYAREPMLAAELADRSTLSVARTVGGFAATCWSCNRSSTTRSITHGRSASSRILTS